MKKRNGKLAEQIDSQSGLKHYERYNSATGQIVPVAKEYTTMSRRPGIGNGWYKKYKSDIYPSDQIHINGNAMRPSRFYDNLLHHDDPELLEQLKQGRRKTMVKYNKDNTPERLAIREKVAKAKQSQHQRKLQ